MHDTYLYTCLDATSPSAARKRFLLSPGSLSLVAAGSEVDGGQRAAHG